MPPPFSTACSWLVSPAKTILVSEAQARVSLARTWVLPEPAGALITETRWPSVRTARAAAAWSSRRPVRVRSSGVSRWLARACVLPWPAARGWRTGCRRAAGRCCARRRAASWLALRQARVLPGRGLARLGAQGAVGEVLEGSWFSSCPLAGVILEVELDPGAAAGWSAVDHLLHGLGIPGAEHGDLRG